MRFPLIAFSIVFPFSLCYPAFEGTDWGARSAAMGGAFCGLSDGCETIPINPAGLAQIISPQWAAFHTRFYSMEELAYSSISYGQPSRLGTLGLHGSAFGRDPYQEFLLLAGYGYPLGRISLGGNVRLMRVQISDYGSANSVGVDLGLLGTVSEGLNFGMSIQNLNSPRIAGDDLPSSLVGGFAMSPARGLILCGDVYKELRHGLETRIGVEYSLGSYLALRSGFKTGPSSMITWGVGCYIGNLELSYSGKNHAALGLTHGFSLVFSLESRTCFGVFQFSRNRQ